MLQKPLETAICPTARCKAVAHLACLAEDFRVGPSTSLDLIPRGGKCRSCSKYTLWGDVIRGCYRRHAGGAVPEEDDDDNLEEEVSAATENDMTDDDVGEKPHCPGASKKSTKGKTITGRGRGRPRKMDTVAKAQKPSKTTKRQYHSQSVRPASISYLFLTHRADRKRGLPMKENILTWTLSSPVTNPMCHSYDPKIGA